jgi:mRNA-degrading endonuclease RelE of RelBE toxin-antitoxin system
MPERVAISIWALEHEAETPTRNRKRLRQPIAGIPGASWELRVGDYRVLYEVRKDRIVRVLRVILKGRMTMDHAAPGGRRE